MKMIHLNNQILLFCNVTFNDFLTLQAKLDFSEITIL